MQRRDVTVRVRGLSYAKNPEDEADEVCTEAPGVYYFKNGRHYFSYEERGDAGETVKNIFKADAEALSYTKSGAVQTVMTFRGGQTCNSRYCTLYGTFEVRTKTKYYKYAESAEGLSLEAEYELYLNDSFSGMRRIIISLLFF